MSALFLSDAIPLRSTAEWGAYADVRPLPWPLGVVEVQPVPYDSAGRIWCVGGYACAGLARAEIDGAPASATYRTAVDETGAPVALVELAAPLQSGQALRCWVRGLVDAQTGALLEDPAEMVGAVLGLAGIPWDDWAAGELRALVRASGLLGGYVCEDASRPLLAVLDDIAGSFGLGWSAERPGYLFDFPPLETPRPVATLRALDFAAAPAPICAVGDNGDGICTVLRVEFGHAGGQPQGAVTLRAVEAVARWGEIDRTWSAPAVTSSSVALAVGRRLLGWFALPRWRITASVARTRAQLLPGDWVVVEHPLLPLTGADHPACVLEASINGEQWDLVLEQVAGDPPQKITIDRVAGAWSSSSTAQGDISVEYRAGVVYLRVLDDSGAAVQGARVTWDGRSTARTDPDGRVQFAAAPGNHTVRIEAAGFDALDLGITI